MRSWLLLGAGLLAAAAGLGWMSATLLRLDHDALVSENSRLALWRMDLALARLISSESTRPATDYAPGSLALGGGPPPGVLLHFDVSARGLVTTPQQGLEDRLARLKPALGQAALPVAVAAAAGGSRNDGEFNRRNLFAMNNSAPAEREAPEAAMAPAWFGEALVLSRRVRLADGIHLQGAWLDWDSLRPQLLREVKDLLPGAQLEPVRSAPRGEALRLASLPVRLVPGAVTSSVDPERTPIWWVISAAWVAFGLFALALGALLFGALTLDERRAAFVSAVTHELRTPLTTFKLYAEMLEEGMVPAEKQKEYLGTLRQEANRLGYLVENVLAYAQIEKGRKSKPLEELPLSQLLERIIPRLSARAKAAQLELTVGEIPAIGVKADRVSVEQILFNLVDNACKYAPRSPLDSARRVGRKSSQTLSPTLSPLGEREAGFHEPPAAVSLEFSATGDVVILSVSDTGPGVSAEVARKLFEPLRKSASEAADGAQGIGLGLALSRRLARAMGGDLKYRKTAGASFELSLVRVTSV